jgi:hypothetical protein
VWEGAQRAVVHRGARRIGELHPDRPMTDPLLTRPVLGHGESVDGDVGRLARAVLDRDGSRWRLALRFAEGPDGVVHRCRPGGDGRGTCRTTPSSSCSGSCSGGASPPLRLAARHERGERERSGTRTATTLP